MRNENFIKTFYADAAIGAHLIVKSGAADNTCAQAAAASDAIIGVSDSLGADAAADPCDVILDGIANVYYGGTVTRGQQLTSDSAGKAIAAAPAATATARVIGIAMQSGVANDLGSVLLKQGAVTNGANS